MLWDGWARHHESGVEADIVPVNIYQLADEMKNNSGNWAGKVLLVTRKGDAPADRMSMFGQFGGISEGCLCGARCRGDWRAGRLKIRRHEFHSYGRARLRYLLRHSCGQHGRGKSNADENGFWRAAKPCIFVSTFRIALTSGPVDSANVVGEIRGTEHRNKLS